jgi:DNA-binding beta-propeller fold protein YncE
VTSQRPHSVEVDGDTYRLWYTGFDGSTQRIGSASGGSLRGRLTREGGDVDDWRLGPGIAGGFDDTGVKDPLAVVIDGVTHLYYAGSDGTTWQIGHVTLDPDGTVVRRYDPLTGLPAKAMGALGRTFSALGADSPVLLSADDGLELAYAGYDGTARRLGLARVPAEAPDEVYPAQRFPTAGDTLSFTTSQKGPGFDVIELGQSTETFAVPAYGMSAMALDAQRGFLYVTTKLDDGVFVVDVRDDSDGTFVDSNHLDLEGLLQVDTGSIAAGFRDIVISPTRGLAYLTQRNPDGLVVVDLSRIPDDGDKELILDAPVAVLPLQSQADDAGVDSYATIGGDGMALSADERFLLVTHFKGNALSVFDLDRGAWGEEIAWITHLGENPHAVRISPDGRWAVVANYLGDVLEDTVSSTLAIVDLDPDSDTYLEAVTWLGNH